MRRNVLILVFYLSGLAQALSQQQPIGNEWINYQQTYFKIPIAQSGIYRITHTELEKAGFPVKSVPPATIQLFHRGVEQAIYVAGEADNQFNEDDFLEFYGRGNDGAQDSLLYRPVSAQPHPYYSLFSDTTAYFLTWRLDGKPGKRMASYSDTNADNLAPEPYHWAEELRLFTDSYPGWAAGIPPKIEYSYYEEGEGYTGLIQQKGQFYDNTFSLDNVYRNGPAPRLDILLAGRGYTDHTVDCYVGSSTATRRNIDSATFSLYTNGRMSKDLLWSDIGNDGKLLVSTISTGNDGSDSYSVSYIHLQYPQRITNNGLATQTYRLTPNPTGRSLLSVDRSNARFWDISDPVAPIRIGATGSLTGSLQLIVRNTYNGRTVLRSDQVKTVPRLLAVTFQNWSERRPTYLIISHESLMKPAGGYYDAVRAYATYRASETGGQHDTLTVSIQQLFDQYSYGERNPLAIRRFADQLLRQSANSPNRPRYLLLIGHSRSTPGVRRNPEQANIDLVLTAGFPGSDLLFTAGLAGEPQDVPAIPTGRLNVTSPQQVIDYLNKVKEFENTPPDQPWRKRILHLSGGTNPGEAITFKSILSHYGTMAMGESLGAQITTIGKKTTNSVESINVAKEVNEGVGLMTFFGHSSLDVSDLDIGFCSNDALGYRNKGKYPLMLINGCASGNIFYSRPTFSSDWVITPNRGAIAAIANSHLGYTDVLDRYSQQFYTLLTDSTSLHQSVGEIQQETIRRVLAKNPTGLYLANAQQMVLQGDPAIRLFPFTTPDYAVTTNDVTIDNPSGQPLTASSDSVRLSIVLTNYGQYRRSALPIRVHRFVDDQETGVYNVVLPRAIAYRDTLFLTLPNDRTAIGLNRFEVTVNPANTIQELNHTNNQASVELTVGASGPVLIYPPQSDTVHTRTVQLVAFYPATGVHTFDIELDTTARFDSPLNSKTTLTAETTITYVTTLATQSKTPYFWRVRETKNPNQWSTGSFTFDPDSKAQGLPEGHIRLVHALPADIEQGDTASVTAQFINLSPYNFSDSLTIQQTLYASNAAQPIVTQWRLKAPVPGDTLRFMTRIPTEKIPGINRLSLTVNPRIQPEYSFVNNTLDLPLVVRPDRTGPLLEVAIDGARLDNGANVSAQPIIDVLVADDNRSLVRRDTLGTELFLQLPGHSRFERLSWRNARILSTNQDMTFRIRYVSPTLSEGTYHLLVTASDWLGNVASPYRISFRVSHERTLTDLTVYPNPFRDQVTFAFRITGDKAPERVNLVITDVAGHIVRALRNDQPGFASRIGLNEWRWDGRSDTGNVLPAGVYLYTLTLDDSEKGWRVSEGTQNQGRGRFIRIR
jgi:hypothetical protein